MRVVSGGAPVLIQVPILTSVDIAQGAGIMLGATADTDLGLAIVATGSGTDFLGTATGKWVYATSSTSALTGATWAFIEIELVDRYAPVWVEYDQTDTMAVASTSGTTVTVTSLEDNIDESWFYAVSGTGAGKLAFLTASASGSATSKTATGWDSTTVLIKILRFGHPIAKLNTAANKIGTDAAAGSWTICVVETWFEAQGYPLTRLDPTKHDNLTLTGARFYANVLIRNTAGHTID